MSKNNDPETETERDERMWLAGSRSALMSTLRHCLSSLGVAGDPRFERERLLIERGEVVAQLRHLCDEFGDNDWDEGDHLGDVIEKHLGRHLYEDFIVDDEPEDEHGPDAGEPGVGFDEELVEYDDDDDPSEDNDGGGELVDLLGHANCADEALDGMAPFGDTGAVHEIESLDEIFREPEGD